MLKRKEKLWKKQTNV